MVDSVIADFRARGLIAQLTAEQELIEHIDSGRRTLYSGFDPTADSLHIGSLVPLLALRRFQLAGHKPLVLVGGATGLIGDPSFKAEERKLNTPDVVGQWVDKLKVQTSRFVDFDAGVASAEVVNNLDWTADVSVLDFLRDTGKHFSVNAMINKESVKQRIDREGDGISFTEFTYMILQSYDFAKLYQCYGCTLQIGGSDQWGNITGGIDLTRRLHQSQVFGMTLPLVTKADGTKFGKTESGTVWLDANKTSPYAFYQFWLNTADADVYRFLKYFTYFSVDEIEGIEKADENAQGRKSAQGILANAVTELVHGKEGVEAASRISQALFSGETASLSEQDFQQLRLDGLLTATIEAKYINNEAPLTQLFVEAGLAKSGKQVKDALSREAVWVNGVPVGWDKNMLAGEIFAQSAARFGAYFLVKLGKKNYGLFMLA